MINLRIRRYVVAVVLLSGLAIASRAQAQFTHRIPIQVPKGANGMQPDLALVYDPNGGNGMVGVGWQLAGLSAITRVNYGNGINYDGQDTYAHSDLGVLVKQSDGTYRSRKESFTKFIPMIAPSCVDSDGSFSPCGWKVVDRNGIEYYYGTYYETVLANSQLKRGNSVRTWALEKVKDPFGNYYRIIYIQGNGRLYPGEIRYTLGPGITSSRTVRFFYLSRTDQEPGYFQSDLQETGQRLWRIEVRTGSELVRRYQLTYQYGTSTGRSQLISVQEYGKDGGALPAQTFEWQQGSIAVTQQPAIPSNGAAVAGDFSGDGKTDIATVTTPTKQCSPNVTGPSVAVAVAKSNGNGFSSPSEWATVVCGEEYSFGGYLGAGDFDGDGKTDIAITTIRTYTTEGGSEGTPTTHYERSLHVLLSNGTSFGKATWSNIFVGSETFYSYVFSVSVGEFNGDSRTDLLVKVESPNWPVSFTFLSTGSGFTSFHHGHLGSLVGDFNGDGKTEFAGRSESTLYVDRFNGSAWVRTTWASDFPSGNIIDMVPIDFQGDGKTDIVLIDNFRQVYIYRSTGTTFIRHSAPFSLPNFAEADSFTVGDLNGDGKTDIITWKWGHSDLFCNLSNGVDFDQVVLSGSVDGNTFTRSEWKRRLLGDFAGQGRKDLGTIGADGSVHILMPNNSSAFGVIPDLMTKVKNGLGGEVAITYQPAPQVYGAVDPNSTQPGIPNTSPRVLVTKMKTSDGRGRIFEMWYFFTDGRIRPGTVPDYRDLGFSRVESFDVQRLWSKRIYYRQDAPYERFVKRVEETVSSDWEGDTYLVSTSDYEYAACPSAPACSLSAKGVNTELVLQSKETTTTYELGVLAFRYTTERHYDQYANVVFVSQDAVNLPSTSLPNLTTTTTYEINAPDLQRWMLNKVRTVTTTSGGATLSAAENIWDGIKLKGKKEWLNTTGMWPETTITQDDNGNVTSVTLPSTGDGRVRATVFEYDNDPFRAAPTRVKNALGHETNTTYYANGLVNSVTDANGAQTVFTYDEFGRKDTVTVAPNGTSTKYLYLQSSQDPVNPGTYPATYYNQSVTTLDECVQIEKRDYFDGTGFVFYSTSQGLKGTGSNCSDIPVEPMVITQYRKDAAGRVVLVSKPYYPGETLLWAWTEYDLVDRIKTVHSPVKISPENNNTSWSVSTVPETMVTQHGYGYSDGTGYESATDNNGRTTTTRFNARKQITQVADAIGQVTAYGHDELGRLTSTTLPGNGGVTSFTYDSWGRRRTLTDPQIGSRSVTFAYDALNRVYEQQVVGDPDLSFHFDYDDSSVFGLGRLRRATDRSGVTEYGYTPLGQLNLVTRNVEGGLTQGYQYDNAGRLTELTYPNGSRVTYRYTAGGNLWKVLLDGLDVATYSNYDARGKPGNVIYGNKVDTTYGYDQAEHLTSLSTKRDPYPGDDPPRTQTTVLQQLTYNWYSGANTGGINLGMITDHRTNTRSPKDNADTNETQTYTYDNLYRLTKAQGVWGAKEFKNFDTIGNPGQFGGLVNRTLSFNGNQVVSGTGLNNVSYDSLGNMQHKELDGVTWDYSWSPENFLKEVKRNGVVTAQMTYDAWGQRTQKIYTSPDTGAKVTTTYFGKTYEKRTYSNVANPAPARHTIYIFANGQLIAQATNEGSSASAYYQANRWKNELAAASVFNGYTAKGFVKKAYHYLNAAALHPKAARTVTLTFFVLFAFGVLALFLASLRNPHYASSFSPQLRLASLSILMIFTFSACGGSDGQDLYSARGYLLEGDTTNGPPIGKYYYHRNHVNSSSVVTNDNGEEVTRIVYVPFGEVAKDNSSGTDTVTSKFTGQEYDDGLGLYYYNSRYYDPAIGRFISADTIIPDAGNAQTYNPYAYVLNNPVKYIDPTGHDVGFSGFDGGNTTGMGTQADRADAAIAAINGEMDQVAVLARSCDNRCPTALPQPPDLVPATPSVRAGRSSRSGRSYGGFDATQGLGRQHDADVDTGTWGDAQNHSSRDPEAQAAGIQSQDNPQRDGLGAGGGHELARTQLRNFCSTCDSIDAFRSGSWGSGVLNGIFAISDFTIAGFALKGLVRNGIKAIGGVATEATAARTFTSTDPLVGELATKIEALYPGHVVGVNVPLRDASGALLTDADIVLQNAAIQVKSGRSAQGLLMQLQKSEVATGLPSIGFGPNLPPGSLLYLSRQGGLVTGDEALLLELIRP